MVFYEPLARNKRIRGIGGCASLAFNWETELTVSNFIYFLWLNLSFYINIFYVYYIILFAVCNYSIKVTCRSKNVLVKFFINIYCYFSIKFLHYVCNRNNYVWQLLSKDNNTFFYVKYIYIS